MDGVQNLYRELLQQRNSLRKKEKEETLSIPEQIELKKVLVDFKNHRDKIRLVEHNNISLKSYCR